MKFLKLIVRGVFRAIEWLGFVSFCLIVLYLIVWRFIPGTVEKAKKIWHYCQTTPTSELLIYFLVIFLCVVFLGLMAWLEEWSKKE